MTVERTYWLVELDSERYDADDYEPPQQVDEADANVVSSLLEDGMHAPAIDLDVPARLVPSSTEGHHHLYIDVPMEWDTYKRLLDALVSVGVVEEGFVSASKKRGMTRLRKPGVPKAVAA